MHAGRRIDLEGVVQGVGFRPFVWRVARELGLGGEVANGAGGVRVEAWGERAALDELVRRLEVEAPPAARLERIRQRPLPPRAPGTFAIAPSASGQEVVASIPPDLATCDACLEEVADPAARRHGYAFTNCTACGPRWTITHAVPYDRPQTTMAGFALCDDCRAEYEDPEDRRFHAQPIACPVCGPELALVAPDGSPHPAGDALAETARLLRAGAIVAIKGLGGFHLACDATDEAVVQRLRARKQREEKPFAVMVADLQQAARLARLDDTARATLAAPDRPIVLLPRREAARGTEVVAPSVAPDCARLGLLMPYTPLHHRLLGAVGRPLVMTSGNVSDQPIEHTNRGAIDRLGPLVDALLLHDRPVANACDDSVVTLVGGRVVAIRHARGRVPRAIALPVAAPEPVLALGGQLKGAACVVVGDRAWLGPHAGDLDDLRTFERMQEGTSRLLAMLDVRPRVVAHDLHPGYATTRWARGLPDVRCEGVQHHHAHAAALAAEHGHEGPFLAVACDGTGWGDDGTAWGGEILLVDGARWRRLASMRPLALPGGAQAIREPWRAALAALDDVFGDEADDMMAGLPGLATTPPAARATLRRMVARGVGTPQARGLGRLFDVAAVLGLDRLVASHEGQLAMAWEQAAAGGRAVPWPVARAREGALDILDMRPALRALVEMRLDGARAPELSARFHATVVAALADAVRRAAAATGVRTVGLTGGCFQNARLAEGLLAALDGAHDVLVHHDVPPGDGGLALGQAIVAVERMRSTAPRR